MGSTSAKRAGLLCASIVVLVLLLGASPAHVRGKQRWAEPIQTKPVDGVQGISRLEGYFPDGAPALFVFNTNEQMMGIYRFIDGQLTYLRRADPEAYVTKAITFVEDGKKKLLVGYEYGRVRDDYRKAGRGRAPRDKIRLVVYDENFEHPKTLYQEHTLQGRINFLGFHGGRLFMHFQHSEEFSKGGYLHTQPDGSVKFKRAVAGRNQFAIDLYERSVLVGSPYSDEEERAMPLTLHRDSHFINLPSLRGVSAVKFMQLDADPEPEIIIGDGLPNERSKRARAQLSVVDYDPKTDRYTRKAVDTLSASQLAIEKIERVMLGDETAVLAIGKRFITLYRPAAGWERTHLYRKRSGQPGGSFDFALLESSTQELTFAVLDGYRLQIMRYKL